MKRLVMAIAAVALAALTANAAPTYLGTSNQDVTLTGQTAQLLIGTTENLKVEVTLPLPAGANRLGAVGLNDGTNAAVINADGTLNGRVKGATGNTLAINADGSINTTNTQVGVSTQVMAGAGGAPIGSQLLSGTTALAVINLGVPNLNGKNFVYASSNSMVAAGVLSLTGLGKEISIQAFGGTCTFTVNGGDPIILDKNTGESFDLAFTYASPTLTLTAKQAASTCKARITGAN